MQPTYIQTATYRAAPLSIEAKKESWRDGYGHALLQMGNFQSYARSPQHYAAGYDEGLRWRERNGLG